MEPATVAIVCFVILSIVVIGRYVIGRVVSYRRLKSAMNTQDRVKRLQTEFRARPSDVFIVTYPKSGTTWMQKIVWLLRTAHNPREGDDRTLADLIPHVEGTLNPHRSMASDVSFSELNAMPSPRTLKSHMPYDAMPGGPPHTSHAKYIYVARNPKDVAVSAYYQTCNIMAAAGRGYCLPWQLHYWIFFKSNRLKTTDFGIWYDHVLGWWKQQNQPNVLFMKYEDMSKDLPASVKKVADFLGCEDLGPEVINRIADQCTFRSMRVDPKSNFNWISKKKAESGAERIDMHFGIVVFFICKIAQLFSSSKSATGDQLKMRMRKGTVGDWKEYLTTEQSNEVDRLWINKLRSHGLEFDFEL